MRPRTPLLAAGAALGATALTVTAALTATAADEPAPQPLRTVDVCAPAAPPKATCFAKLVVSGGPAATLAAPAGLGPADLTSAYAIPAGGSGQTVGIVVAFSSPTLEADLAVYRSTFGLPACTSAAGCLRIVNQDGAASPLPPADAGWALETALDVDMVSAACPACRILVVHANSNGLDDLGAAVSTAVRLGADVVSNSYGTGVEFAGQAAYESHYIHPGVPLVVAAGDIGYSVSFPAASPYVTAVGGTTLTRNASGAWTERVWSGTGSGCSAYMPKPSWQTDPNCPMRMVNDVGAVADPSTGVAIYDSFQNAGWLVVGGTSAATPIIAGMYALTGTAANRVNDGSTPWRRHTAAGAFRDVTSGTNVPGPNAATCGGDYLCTGVPGYDGPTGWGTPLGIGGLTAP
ncbi:S53 family peptidase [Paractinoplanes rishiriensis]|uniref:Peptidase S8 n=1 Tax=Paractinoplanes rishiriensis TaxID=1050105 RepID=A0A919JXH2_9ACTN|nr:S53 family peptidase [Actinoplanes rishiriensis]GIE95320.1 peptidase S8 [Actinoplanes rishiriensis]